MENDLRAKVIRFLKRSWERGEGVPPIRRILRETGMYRKQLYSIFPKGIVQICEYAGVPTPGRFRSTEAATKARFRERGKHLRIPSIKLPSELSESLLVLANLEHKDPLAALKSLLDLYHLLREHGIILSEVRGTIGLAKKAEEIGVPKLSETEFKSIKDLVRQIKKDGWEPSEFVDYATANYNSIHNFRRYLRREISLDTLLEE